MLLLMSGASKFPRCAFACTCNVTLPCHEMKVTFRNIILSYLVERELDRLRETYK